MGDKTGKSAIITIVLFLLFKLIILWFAMVGIKSKAVWSETGEFDLRLLFSENDTFHLRGSVEYIPNALLTPAEFEARAGEALFGDPDADTQYVTSRTRIILPNDDYYTFYRKSIGFAHRIYANGKLVLEMGIPGESRAESVPNTGTILLYLKADNNEIELVQQVSNFVHRESEGHNGWRVSTRNPRAFLVFEMIDYIMIGSFLTLFVVHIIMFILLRTYKANLYFALFCLIWLFRTGATGTKIFTDVLPWMSWTLKFRLEYIVVPLTAVLLVLILDLLFPGILHKWFRKVVFCVSALFVLIFLFTDTVFMSYAILWCEAVYILAFFYVITRLAMKLRRIRQEQSVFLVGGIIFFLTTLYDIAYYNNIIRKTIFVPQDLSITSMLILTFYQAAAVFIVTVREMKAAEAENAALKERELIKEEMLYLQYGLTKREKEIAALLVNEGLSIEEIAETLFLSSHTVKFHIYNIYRKFNVKNRGEFMAVFVRKV